MAQIGARIEPEPGDLTPAVSAPTDVAPAGRDMPKPQHELTANEDVDTLDWNRLAESDDFKELVAAKIRFILPATIFFLVYYLLLPLLAGFAKGFMDIKVIGDINIAYLFALSQFVMVGVLAWLYLRQAVHFDDMAHDIVAKFKTMKGGK